MSKITQSEWEVMEVLWEADRPLFLGEIIEALSAEGKNRSSKTVGTFLSRLVTKGAAKTTKRGRNNLYEAALARTEGVETETRSFLERIFRGATAPAVLHLLEDSDLTADEISELQSYLDQRKS